MLQVPQAASNTGAPGRKAGCDCLQKTGTAAPVDPSRQSVQLKRFTAYQGRYQEHYRERFEKFIAGWLQRGYKSIPDEAPHDLEVKQWAPSWKRMARCILRNDYYCKGLGQTQPLSEAYQKWKAIKAKRKMEEELK